MVWSMPLRPAKGHTRLEYIFDKDGSDLHRYRIVKPVAQDAWLSIPPGRRNSIHYALPDWRLAAVEADFLAITLD